MNRYYIIIICLICFCLPGKIKAFDVDSSQSRFVIDKFAEKMHTLSMCEEYALVSSNLDNTIESTSGFKNDTQLLDLCSYSNQSIKFNFQQSINYKLTSEFAKRKIFSPVKLIELDDDLVCENDFSKSIIDKIYVSVEGDDRNDGYYSTPLRSIQKAINTAKPGDTVIVKNGVFNENIILTKRIVIGSEFLIDGNQEHISKTIINGSYNKEVIRVIQPEIINNNESNESNEFAIVGLSIVSNEMKRSGGGVHLYFVDNIKLRNLVINSISNVNSKSLLLYNSSGEITDVKVNSILSDKNCSQILISGNRNKLILNNIEIDNIQNSNFVEIQKVFAEVKFDSLLISKCSSSISVDKQSIDLVTFNNTIYHDIVEVKKTIKTFVNRKVLIQKQKVCNNIRNKKICRPNVNDVLAKFSNSKNINFATLNSEFIYAFQKVSNNYDFQIHKFFQKKMLGENELVLEIEFDNQEFKSFYSNDFISSSIQLLHKHQQSIFNYHSYHFSNLLKNYFQSSFMNFEENELLVFNYNSKNLISLDFVLSDFYLSTDILKAFSVSFLGECTGLFGITKRKESNNGLRLDNEIVKGFEYVLNYGIGVNCLTNSITEFKKISSTVMNSQFSLNKFSDKDLSLSGIDLTQNVSCFTNVMVRSCALLERNGANVTNGLGTQSVRFLRSCLFYENRNSFDRYVFKLHTKRKKNSISTNRFVYYKTTSIFNFWCYELLEDKVNIEIIKFDNLQNNQFVDFTSNRIYSNSNSNLDIVLNSKYYNSKVHSFSLSDLNIRMCHKPYQKNKNLSSSNFNIPINKNYNYDNYLTDIYRLKVLSEKRSIVVDRLQEPILQNYCCNKIFVNNSISPSYFKVDEILLFNTTSLLSNLFTKVDRFDFCQISYCIFMKDMNLIYTIKNGTNLDAFSGSKNQIC